MPKKTTTVHKKPVKKVKSKKTVQKKPVNVDEEEAVFTRKNLAHPDQDADVEKEESESEENEDKDENESEGEGEGKEGVGEDEDAGDDTDKKEVELDSEDEEESSSDRKTLVESYNPISTSHVLADPMSRSNEKSKRSEQKDAQEKMERQLEALYQNDDGKMPNLNTFEKRKRSSVLRALGVFFFSLFLLLAVASAGLFYFRPNSAFQEKGVSVLASGLKEVQIGKVETYRIEYRNDSGADLSEATLRVRYPEGFVVTDTSRAPSNEAKDEWSLGLLRVGETGFVDISGSFYANLGSAQSFRVFLDYLPANFSSSFQAVAVTEVTLLQSPYELSVSAPEEVVAGNQMDIKIRIKNTDLSTTTSSLLFLRLESGESFVIGSSAPRANEFETAVWTVPTTTPEFEVVVSGNFIPVEGVSEVEVPIRVLAQHPLRPEEKIVASEFVYKVRVIQTEVVLDRVVNGATGELSVQPGDVLATSLVLRNTGEAPLQNVQIRAILVAPAFNDRSILAWDKLEDPLDGNIVGEKVNPLIRRGIITWDGTKSAALKKIDQGKEVTIDFSLPVRSGADVELGNFTTSTAEFIVEARYTLGTETKVISSSPLKMTFNSDLRFATRHEENRSGDAATHEVAWILENSFHDLKNITAVASIYGDVVVAKDKMVIPAGEVNYDEKEKKLTWKIEQMPTSIDVLPFRFVIEQKSINPSQTELISKVEIRATDVETGRQIILVDSAVKLRQ